MEWRLFFSIVTMNRLVRYQFANAVLYCDNIPPSIARVSLRLLAVTIAGCCPASDDLSFSYVCFEKYYFKATNCAPLLTDLFLYSCPKQNLNSPCIILELNMEYIVKYEAVFVPNQSFFYFFISFERKKISFLRENYGGIFRTYILLLFIACARLFFIS